MPDESVDVADPRAAFDALRALEDLLLEPHPDPGRALDAVRRLEEALKGGSEATA